MNIDTITHGWLVQRGPINLRHTPKKDTRSHDLRAAKGIILGLLIGLNIWIGIVILVRWPW